MSNQNSRKNNDEPGVGLGGLLNSLGGFLDLVSNFAEKQQEIQRSGEVSSEDKNVKAVYGFSVKVGGGGKPTIEPFGNVIKKGSQGPVVDEEREPMVDVFDEEGHVMVVVELPGVGENDIKFVVDGTNLSLSAGRGDRKYSKEIRLPAACTGEGAAAACRNGVFELKLTKVGG